MFFANRAFWEASTERAVKTFAQTFAALLAASATSLLDLDWGQDASVAGLATLASLLTSIGSGAVGTGNGGPSLTGAEKIETAGPEPDPAPTGRRRKALRG